MPIYEVETTHYRESVWYVENETADLAELTAVALAGASAQPDEDLCNDLRVVRVEMVRD